MLLHQYPYRRLIKLSEKDESSIEKEVKTKKKVEEVKVNQVEAKDVEKKAVVTKKAVTKKSPKKKIDNKASKPTTPVPEGKKTTKKKVVKSSVSAVKVPKVDEIKVSTKTPSKEWTTNPMLKPLIEKVTVNMSVGKSGAPLQQAVSILKQLTDQEPSRRAAKKTIREFGIRKGESIACLVTIRDEKA